MLLLGAAVAVLALISGFLLFALGQGSRIFDDMETVRADFRTITGLRKGSPVQLAGVLVGEVDRIDFVRVTYTCDPLTEDIGRYGAGRTDDCDEFLFCAPTGLCGELEPYAKGEHQACSSTDDCRDDEICVTSDFRKRTQRVMWQGPLGVCARYQTEHWRASVKMEIEADKLDLIRADSKATVASNSVLGDQLVNITVGTAEPLGSDHRIQAQSSLYEDIDRFRTRVESFTDTAEISLDAVLRLVAELQDERTIAAIKGTIENLSVITGKLAHGEGLLGAFLSEPTFKRDFGVALSAFNSTSAGLHEATDKANTILTKVDRNLGPFLDDTAATMRGVDRLLADLDASTNKSLVSKLLRDPDGRLADELAGILDHASEISGSAVAVARAIESGKGTVGRVINDPSVHRDVVRLLHNLADHDLIRSLALIVLDRRFGIDVASSRDPVAP